MSNFEFIPGKIFKIPQKLDYKNISKEFLANGIVKIAVEDDMLLHQMRVLLNNIQAEELMVLNNGMLPEYLHNSNYLDKTHEHYKPSQLNDLRLRCINRINNSEADYRKSYFSLAKNALHELVGNELVMQRNINLSIQLPGDDSSLLPVHADVLQGDSPYEVVVWVPLVDCYDSKSMFFSRKQPAIEGKTLEQLYVECAPYFVDCKYGEALIFSQNYFHGNRINETNETRWSLNCRFKSLFSPYSDKKLGEFFEPVEIKPATRLGLNYQSLT